MHPVDVIRTHADRRVLSPLLWTHVNPYGRFTLDMSSQLDLVAVTVVPADGPERLVRDLPVVVGDRRGHHEDRGLLRATLLTTEAARPATAGSSTLSAGTIAPAPEAS